MKIICPSCQYVGESKGIAKGSRKMEITLWCFLLLPGVLYTLWRQSKDGQYQGCPQCHEANVRLIKEKNGKHTSETDSCHPYNFRKIACLIESKSVAAPGIPNKGFLCEHDFRGDLSRPLPLTTAFHFMMLSCLSIALVGALPRRFCRAHAIKRVAREILFIKLPG